MVSFGSAGGTVAGAVGGTVSSAGSVAAGSGVLFSAMIWVLSGSFETIAEFLPPNTAPMTMAVSSTTAAHEIANLYLTMPRKNFLIKFSCPYEAGVELSFSFFEELVSFSVPFCSGPDGLPFSVRPELAAVFLNSSFILPPFGFCGTREHAPRGGCPVSGFASRIRSPALPAVAAGAGARMQFRLSCLRHTGCGTQYLRVPKVSPGLRKPRPGYSRAAAFRRGKRPFEPVSPSRRKWKQPSNFLL